MAAGAVLLAVGFLPLFAFSFILGNDIKFLLPASAQALNLLQNDYFLPAALALGRVRRYRPAHAAVDERPLRRRQDRDGP